MYEVVPQHSWLGVRVGARAEGEGEGEGEGGWVRVRWVRVVGEVRWVRVVVGEVGG